MQLVPVILLDRNAEVPILAEALRPWALVKDEIKDPQFLKKIQVYFNRFEDGNRELRLVDLPDLRLCLNVLRTRLQQDLDLEPDPEWVEQAHVDLENGCVPVIMNPEEALGMLKGVRERQIAKILQAQQLVDRADVLVSSVIHTNNVLSAFRRME